VPFKRIKAKGERRKIKERHFSLLYPLSLSLYPLEKHVPSPPVFPPKIKFSVKIDADR
jgi:hypothetical protein